MTCKDSKHFLVAGSLLNDGECVVCLKARAYGAERCAETAKERAEQWKVDAGKFHERAFQAEARVRDLEHCAEAAEKRAEELTLTLKRERVDFDARHTALLNAEARAEDAEKRAEALTSAVKALYYSACWTADRPVDARKLWTDLRDTAGFAPGGSPAPVAESAEALLREAREVMERALDPLSDSKPLTEMRAFLAKLDARDGVT